MTDASASELTLLAEVWTGVSNRSRLAIMIGLREGKNLPDIAEELGVTRGGMQKHVERLVKSELVYRPADPDKTYALTPLGEFVLGIVTKHHEKVIAAMEHLDEVEDQADDIDPEQLLELVEAVGDREKAKHTWKWEQAWEDVAEPLDSEPQS